MKLIRVIFLVFCTQFLMATSCIKRQGAQINTYKLSSCPKEDYVLPNFAETEDLILTQESSDDFKCRNFKSYAKMTKEGIETGYWEFLVKIEKDKFGCSLEVMTPRYCRTNESCSVIPKDIHRYVTELEKTLAQFLFREDKSISITGESAVVVMEEGEFKKLCEKDTP